MFHFEALLKLIAGRNGNNHKRNEIAEMPNKLDKKSIKSILLEIEKYEIKTHN